MVNAIRLSEQWETTNFIIEDVTPNEISQIQKLYEKSSYMRKLGGTIEEDPTFIENCVIKGDLPPNGVRELYSIQHIRFKETKELCGYVDFYRGYPKEDTLWLGFLFIDPTYQNKGYGKEIAIEFFALAKKAGWNNIRINLFLKNWSALRFWIDLGFDKILLLTGDRELGEETFADLVLEKAL